MADRIAVLEGGHVQQFAGPTEIYDSPANMFVNEFIGTTNLLPGTLTDADAGISRVRLGDGSEVTVEAAPPGKQGESVIVSVRPEGLRFAAEGEQSTLAGHVTIAMPLGPSVIYDVALDAGCAVKVEVARGGSGGPVYHEGERVSLAFTGGNTLSLFPSEETTREN